MGEKWQALTEAHPFAGGLESLFVEDIASHQTNICDAVGAFRWIPQEGEGVKLTVIIWGLA